MKLDFSPAQNNSKWIKDRNMRPDTLNLTEEKAGNVLNRTSAAQTLRPTVIIE